MGANCLTPSFRACGRASTPSPKRLRALVADLAPKLDAAKARLEQLGPKPKEDDPDESADVARDRAEREAAVAELDETQRLARAVLIQAEQFTAQVGDRRRAAFTRALFERTYGILSPDLWVAAARNFPRDLSALGIVARDTIERIARNATLGVLLLLGLAFGVAAALVIGRRYLAPRLVTRDPAIHDPSRRKRLLAALGVLLLGALPAAAGSFLDLCGAARHGRAAAPRAAARAGVSGEPRLRRLRPRARPSDPGAGDASWRLAAAQRQGGGAHRALRGRDRRYHRRRQDTRSPEPGDRGGAAPYGR